MDFIYSAPLSATDACFSTTKINNRSSYVTLTSAGISVQFLKFVHTYLISLPLIGYFRGKS